MVITELVKRLLLFGCWYVLSPTYFPMYFVWWWEYFVWCRSCYIYLFIYIYVYSNTHNIPPIMIISRIYKHQNLLSLQLLFFLVGLRTYQRPWMLRNRSSYLRAQKSRHLGPKQNRVKPVNSPHFQVTNSSCLLSAVLYSIRSYLLAAIRGLRERTQRRATV